MMPTGDGMSETLTRYLRSLGHGPGLSEHAGLLLAHIITRNPAPGQYASHSLRRTASTLGMTVYQTRSASQLLLQREWIEKQPGCVTAAGRYRVTVVCLRELQSVLPSLLGPMAQINPEAIAHQAFVDEPSVVDWQRLTALTEPTVLHRLTVLNRARRDPYQLAYHKTTLRNIGLVLAWFITYARTQSTRPMVVAVRRLAQETGLVFATTKRARDYLVHWQVLENQGDLYRLHATRLLRVLTGEDELPGPELLRSEDSRS
jgi:hypothetical protein